MRLKETVGAKIPFSIFVDGNKEMSLTNGETRTIEIAKGSNIDIKVNRFVKESSFKLYKDENVIVIIEIRSALYSKRGLTTIVVKDDSLVSIIR
jgi:hypothetical protein